jgi:glutaminyl-peptide cyclotransferase
MSVFNALFFLPIVIILRYLLNNESIVRAVSWNSKQWPISAKALTDSDYLKLSQLTEEDYQQFNQTLDNLLIPRVPGTEGHRRVRKYITNVMQSLEWRTDLDTFKAQTPHGLKQFSNIIATLDPKACKRLVLACHYDSKLSSSGLFVGATDSAVPCALMIELVKSLDKYLKLHRDSSSSDTTLQLIFFDGEEEILC